MSTGQATSTAGEEQVQASIEQALLGEGGTTKERQPGRLVMEVGGSVAKAYLAGGFRGKMKMPQEIVITTSGGPGGTGIMVDAHSRGTGGGVMSGSVLGAIKQRKAEAAWVQAVLAAIPAKQG
jgi:hypothetical protein